MRQTALAQPILTEERLRRFIEAQPNQPLLRKPDDITLVMEACFSRRTHTALLYAPNLTENFFDLSSREAGAILQKTPQLRHSARLGLCSRGRRTQSPLPADGH